MTPDTLTTLIAKVQATLQDNGTLFSTATITAAARQALLELNKRAAAHVALTIAAIAAQKEYELSDEDPAASGITDVLLEGADDSAASLKHAAYVEDNRWFFRLANSQAAGQSLIVQYTKPHTVNGLDGAADSTLDDPLNTALLNGTIYYCCLSRAAATLEANNVAPNVTVNWIKLADVWRDIFERSLDEASRQSPAKGDFGQAAAWDDDQHDPTYP